MKKILNGYKMMQGSTGLGLVVIFLLLLLACNSKDDKKVEGTNSDVTNSSTSNNNTETETTITGAGKFYILRLDSADVWNLMSNSNQKRKILLQFVDSAGGPIGLVAYSTEVHNKVPYGPVGLKPEAGYEPWDTTGVKILGTLELSRKELKKALQETGALTAKKCHTLYFWPTKDANNYIFYKAGRAPYIKPVTGDTKPSPPAPPCDPCD